MPQANLRTCFILLSAVAVASSQTLPPKPLPKEPLEKYDNPPAPYVFRIETSPQMVSQHGPFTSYQVNVDSNGNNILHDAANEPSICVDPTNRNKMAIGWRQFDSVASNFRQAGYAYTANGGTSWRFPGVLQSNVFRSDPVLNSNNVGQFFYLSLLQNFFDDLWRSLNGGQSWANIAPADGGDKQWFTIDNTNSTGHGFQYQFWSTDGNNYGGRQFSRSTNGGLNWMNPINIPNSPAWGTLDVDSNGNLFIGGVNLTTNQIWCVRSTNAKNGVVVPTFDQSSAVSLGGNIVSAEPINPAGLVGQVFLAVDRSGTSTNDNIYMLASVQPTGFTSGSDVMFVRSTNGGQTFSAPRRINDDPVNHAKWHWFGTLSVAPNGRIDAVWLDTRNAANNTNSQLFYSFSLDGGNTWSPNVAVSNSFNPFVGYPSQGKLGDYITIVSDNAGANVAYAATFNGEEDVYYVRIAPTAAQSSWNLIATTDFNSNGNPDYVLYNTNTGATAVWYMNNSIFVSAAWGPTLPPGWNLATVADFNRDGFPDYALSIAATGQTVIGYLSGVTVIGAAVGPAVPHGWALVATGDFTGDGNPDYVLYNGGTHQTAIGYLNNNVLVGGALGPTLPAGWSLASVADFDRDGHPDYALFIPATGQTVIGYLSGPTVIGAAVGPTVPHGWALVATGDFNGDGNPDYVLYNGGTHQTAIWYLNNNVFLDGALGPTLP
jgi:hypothetical protein